MVPTARGSGVRVIKVKVTAGELSKMSDPVSVTVKKIGMPTVTLSVNPQVIYYGEKAPLTSSAAADECAQPPAVEYTASEGAIAGMVFDSTPMQFDMANRTKVQTRVVQLTAKVTDKIGQTAVAPATITVILAPQPRRLDDLVFSKNNDRVNNCGKRLLLEELTPMLRSDPEAKVILIGHRDGDEKKAGLDEQRVLNAAAVLSAGTGICPQLDLSRILVNSVGTDQGSVVRPALCGTSTNIRERAGQGVSESDKRAPYRRVEVWIVPGGAPMPAGMTGLKAVPAGAVQAKGCPK